MVSPFFLTQSTRLDRHDWCIYSLGNSRIKICTWQTSDMTCYLFSLFSKAASQPSSSAAFSFSFFACPRYKYDPKHTVIRMMKTYKHRPRVTVNKRKQKWSNCIKLISNTELGEMRLALECHLNFLDLSSAFCRAFIAAMALSKTAFRLPWKRGSMWNHGVQTEPPLTTTSEALAIRILVFLIFIIFILPFQLPEWSVSNRKNRCTHAHPATYNSQIIESTWISMDFPEHVGSLQKLAFLLQNQAQWIAMNCVSLQWIHANFIIANSCPKAKCLISFWTGKGASWEMLYRRCGGYVSSSWVQYMQLLTKNLEKWSVKKSALNPTQGPPSLFPIKGASISSASSSASSPAALPHTLAQRLRLENVTSFHMKLELIDHAFSFM